MTECRVIKVWDNNCCEACEDTGSYEVITVDGYYIQECLHDERKVRVERRREIIHNGSQS